MDDLRNGLMPQNAQQTIDPRDLSTRREGLQRALELVTTDYVTNLNSCPILPMPEQMQEQMEDIAQWTRLYHMDKVVRQVDAWCNNCLLHYVSCKETEQLC